jgi:hypothetical protein
MFHMSRFGSDWFKLGWSNRLNGSDLDQIFYSFFQYFCNFSDFFNLNRYLLFYYFLTGFGGFARLAAFWRRVCRVWGELIGFYSLVFRVYHRLVKLYSRVCRVLLRVNRVWIVFNR